MKKSALGRGLSALIPTDSEEAPSSLKARHISPCVTPEIHIETAYKTTPMVDVQKCTSISLVEYMPSLL